MGSDNEDIFLKSTKGLLKEVVLADGENYTLHNTSYFLNVSDVIKESHKKTEEDNIDKSLIKKVF